MGFEPVVMADDARLLGRVADRDPPRPREQRRLNRRGGEIGPRADVVEEAPHAVQRFAPEDRVADEAVGPGRGEERLELGPGASGVDAPPGQRGEA